MARKKKAEDKWGDWEKFYRDNDIGWDQVWFEKHPEIGWEGEKGYITNYAKLSYETQYCGRDEVEAVREVVKNDVWFITHFILKNTRSNHPFIVQACKDLQFGPRSHTADLWFRGAFKTTIISVAETIQDICRNPEERIAIFSYTKGAARKIFSMVKYALESSELLKVCFPEIFWANPQRDADTWSDEKGLVVKRKGIYREPTLSYWGLLDGMPTGDHFTKRIYDDILVEEIADSPDVNEKLKEKFDLSFNLSTFQETDTVRIVGTPYNYFDVLDYIEKKVDVITGEKLYLVRKKPATVDGTTNGESVFHPEKALAEARTNMRKFRAQQLIDPAPQDELRLNSKLLVDIDPDKIPKNIVKVMPIDPAGLRTSDDREGDSWAMAVIGMEKSRNEVGAANIYIIDLIINPMMAEEALENVSKMYMRNGIIQKIGVEKVGVSTFEIHISNYLRSKGRIVTVENGGLYILRPNGRKKEARIESNLVWPLNNGKIHISTAIPLLYRERLALEMEKFPYWKDDGLDMLAYSYDMFKDFKFSKALTQTEQDEWDKKMFRDEGSLHGWQIQ